MENTKELNNQLLKVKKMKSTTLFLRCMMIGFLIIFISFTMLNMLLYSAFIFGIICKLAYDIEQHNFSLKLETLMVEIIKNSSNCKENELPSFLK